MNEATEGLITLLLLIWGVSAFFFTIVFLIIIDNEP